MKKKSIKGWRERADLPADFPMFHMTAVEKAMQEEIDELRERLGMPAEPVEQQKDPRQLSILEDGAL